MLKQEQIKMPELAKLLEVKGDSQRIGDFLEWLSGEEITLAKWTGEDCMECGGSLMDITQTREQLLANYFKIDLVKCEQERQTLLNAVREDNEENQQ